MTAINVAAVQFMPVADRQRNLSVIRANVLRAQEQGARVVVLPEYSAYFTGRLDEETAGAAEPLDGPFVTAVRELAENAGVAIVVGFLREPADPRGKPTNTVIAVGPAGEILSVYDKIHLYDAFGAQESTLISAGNVMQSAVFSLDGFVLGVQTCYDLRFPELTRRLSEQGTDAILIPAQWVPGPAKVLHWETLLRSRAIENICYVVGTDQSAPNGIGHTAVFGPSGVCLGELGEEDDILIVELDRERVSEARALNPALKLRRLGETSSPLQTKVGASPEAT